MRRLFMGLFSVMALLAASGPVAAQRPVKHALDPRKAVEPGELLEYRIPSKIFGRERRVLVYTPAEYSESHVPYDVLFVFDGNEYVTTIPLPMILDTLIARGRISPTVAVFIDDSTSTVRLDDLANHARFVSFVTNEVLAFVRGMFNVTQDPRHSAIMGSSGGGLAAAYVAGERPDLFQNVLSLSGAFWRGNEGSNSRPFEWLTSHYDAMPKHDLRFILDVGALETNATLGGSGPVFIEATRRFNAVLHKKGYPVQYTEVLGGKHADASWQKRIPSDLVSLFTR